MKYKMQAEIFCRLQWRGKSFQKQMISPNLECYRFYNVRLQKISWCAHCKMGCNVTNMTHGHMPLCRTISHYIKSSHSITSQSFTSACRSCASNSIISTNSFSLISYSQKAQLTSASKYCYCQRECIFLFQMSLQELSSANKNQQWFSDIYQTLSVKMKSFIVEKYILQETIPLLWL